MRSRLRFENELEKKLSTEGWATIRSAGSRGPFDLIAVGSDVVRLIQVKSTKDFNRRGNVSVFTDAIQEMQATPEPPCSRRELWVRVLREGWRYAVVDDAPVDRESLKQYVRDIDWVFVR